MARSQRHKRAKAHGKEMKVLFDGALRKFGIVRGQGINAGDYMALGSQWQRYYFAGGVANSNLIDRRQREWALFVS